MTFGIYLAIVGYLTLTPTSYAFGNVPTMKPFWVGNAPTNPIPFRGIEMDFYLNILMMVPMGIYLKLLFKINVRQMIATGFLMGVGIESTQFILDTFLQMSRWIDINDILTNAGGVVIGYLLVLLLEGSPFRRIVNYFSIRNLM
ncbi:VanZ family protein [Secundilactobacillus pentosiphilus]|uniref:VanZ family protein n=1 Tax=Secundilactobacillus pentosiphilus TaxID=1714682 RepID=UPI0015C5EFB3|nr:VanZ family protein [Secundilactobacillus pentosiphilus]